MSGCRRSRSLPKGFAMRSLLASTLLLACLPLAITACGDDDDEGGGAADGPQVFEVQANEGGVTAPESVRPGAIEIRFTNTGEKDHLVQIVALADGHSADEIKEAGEAWGEKGKPLPEWISFVGGVGSTKGGEAAS